MEQGLWHNSALALRLAAAAIILLGWAASAAAQNITEYAVPVLSPFDFTNGITAGPDGALWFTVEPGCTPCSPIGQIGRITTSAAITEYPVSEPNSIAAGPDGALWFTAGSSFEPAGRIGRITTAGTITEYPVPTPGSIPAGIAAGPDGALWFGDSGTNAIGRITTSGEITEYALPAGAPVRSGIDITAGPDGALWFTERSSGRIGRITTAATITEYPIPTPNSDPTGIAAGPDGALWFAEYKTNKIGRITTDGAITEYPTPTPQSGPFGIAAGPDGAMWFTEIGQIGPDQLSTNKIGRITTAGEIAEYPCADSCVGFSIVAAPDGAMWFTSDIGRIGRITVPASTGPLFAAVLPSSRSVQVGNTATAFATIINTGAAASGCAMAPVTPVPASFVYQTTNPATNALTGSPHTPASIGAGGSQSFVIAFTPNAPFVPTNVMLGFDCAGVNAAPSETGLNTLLLSASATPVPDIVALVATPGPNNGILRISGVLGTQGCAGCGLNAFAVATFNLGSGDTITATPVAIPPALPLALTICQTNSATGVCIGGPAGQTASATQTVSSNATPTFAVFAAASGTISFVPQTNRIFVQFTDGSGAIRGETSVAVCAQPLGACPQ